MRTTVEQKDFFGALAGHVAAQFLSSWQLISINISELNFWHGHCSILLRNAAQMMRLTYYTKINKESSRVREVLET